VFDARPRRYADRYFTLLVASGRAKGQIGPRLGLAISRKQARRAVDRNRLKRLIREAFRHRQKDLPPVDIVVMVRSAACQLDNAGLAACLDRHMDALARQKSITG
jgi:ribonuclease P protein component